MEWAFAAFAFLVLIGAAAVVITFIRLKDKLADALVARERAEGDARRWELLYHAELDEAMRLDRTLKEVRGELDQVEKDLAKSAAVDPRGLADRLRRSLSAGG